MKHAASFMLLLAALFVTACTKVKSDAPTNALAGRWKLIQTLHDIGNGKSTWQTVTGAEQRLLLFTPQNRLAGDAFPQARSYEIVDAATLKFLYADGTFIYYNYKHVGATLELSGGGCIEACGLKFKNENSYN